jgi:amidase
MFENKSILEITSLIKSKEATVKEVVKFYLERIKQYNPALNAIVLQKEEEQIFHEVNLKDNEDNKLKPLFGLPLACKDLFDIEGIPSTYGFPPYKNNIAKKNSLIVDRLINSGAIIIGKTNTAEL